MVQPLFQCTFLSDFRWFSENALNYIYFRLMVLIDTKLEIFIIVTCQSYLCSAARFTCLFYFM